MAYQVLVLYRSPNSQSYIEYAINIDNIELMNFIFFKYIDYKYKYFNIGHKRAEQML